MLPRRRAARDFLRAPVLRCSAPRLTALSIVVGLHSLLLTTLDRALQPAEECLDLGRVTTILQALPLSAQDSLLLRVDVGHSGAVAEKNRGLITADAAVL